MEHELGFESADSNEIKLNKIETYLEPNLQILFEKKEELKRSKSGKLKQFSSFVNN